MTNTNFYSNGKLLITGEYLVLDGAISLALPTKQGQYLSVKKVPQLKGLLQWQSFDIHKNCWFNCDIALPSLQLIKTNHQDIAKTLLDILCEVRKLNTDFLNTPEGLSIHTDLTFERNWGLGTSSTLINNIASWGNVNPFDLQFKIFGGSAYDIACAQNNHPLIYQLKNKQPLVKTIDFNPEFKDSLYFIHLNEKQNSREAIKSYKKNTDNKQQAISEISDITHQMTTSKSVSDFGYLIKKHEHIVSKIISTEPIKNRLFSDYFGEIKSLGAWGGDFILATGNLKTPDYFYKKGFKTVLLYKAIIL